MNDNELRVEAAKESKNSDIAISSFGASAPIKKSKNAYSNAYSLIADEIGRDAFSAKGYDDITAKKPKLVEPIILLAFLLTVDFFFAVFCYLTSEITFAVSFVFTSSATMPICAVFFFYRLDTRGNLTVLSVLKYVTAGVVICYFTEFLFERFIKLPYINNYIVTLIKCSTEVITILVCTAIFANGNKKSSATTLILIAASLAAGFALIKGIVDTFDTLFLTRNIPDEDGNEIIVGVIINSKEGVARSIDMLIRKVFFSSIFQPTVFIGLMTVCGYSLFFIFNRKSIETEKNGLSAWVTVLVCVLLLSLVAFEPSVIFLRMTYSVTAGIITAYIFIKMLNDVISRENYEDK